MARPMPRFAPVTSAVRFFIRSELALHPGQAGLAPAAERAAVLLSVLVAFEAFQDVVGLFPAGASRGIRRGVRTHAGAAEEHYRRLFGYRAGQLGEELGIRLVA